MTEEIIDRLPIQLKDYICTLKKASTDTSNRKSMCESTIKVINFDKIPNEYSRGRGWPTVPKSNDALYIDIHEEWYFIEFKNGNVCKDEVYRKLYDSLMMLLEWGVIPNLDFIRQKINYILVYNEGKYGKIQQSDAREQTYGYFLERAKQEERLFSIDDFEGYLFKKTHTYTEKQFKVNFIDPKEKEEGISS